MKQLPRLTLVSKEEAAAGSHSAGNGPSFDLISLEDLKPQERSRIQHIVDQLCPKSAILAVAQTSRPWDLRPVLTRQGESGPSIIRFSGPDIQASTQINARLRETFERVKGAENISSMLLNWGIFENDLWYRRPLVELTLAHVLSGTRGLNEEQTFAVAFSLVEEVFRWHERGVVHSHITSSNIVVNATGKVGLLDAGMGLATIQTSKGKTDYNLQSFAPEVLGGQTVVYSADIYGIGLVIRRLFLTLAKRYQYEKNREEHEAFIRPFIDLSTAMLDPEPRRRPGLPQVRHFIADAYEKRQAGKNPASRTRRPTTVSNEAMELKGSPEQNAPVRERRNDSSGSQAKVERVVEKVFEQPTPPPAAPAPQEQPPPQNQHIPQQGPAAAPYAAQPYAVPFVQQPAFITQSPYPGAAPQAFTGGPHVHTGIYQVMAGQAQPVASQPIQYIAQPPGYAQPGYAQPNYVNAVHPGPFVQQPYLIPGSPGQFAHTPSADSHAAIQSLPHTSTSPKKESGLFPLLFAFGLLLTGFYYYRMYGLESVPVIGSLLTGSASDGNYSHLEMREDWESRLPSRMVRVAQAAISREQPSEFAESLIIRSVLKGEAVGNGINVGLLRIAFDSAWERELSAEDRRAALALGFGGLLRESIPQDLPGLDRLHPGVILALTANVNAKNAGKGFFSNIPAVVLTKLPPPWGPTFQELVSRHPDLTCNDEMVQHLARLGTSGGVEIIDELTAFLKDDSPERLRALAMLFSQDNRLAHSVLEVLLNHPNLSLGLEPVKWGKDWELLSWSELEPSDKLFVLAGIPPAAKVADANIGKLFAHPLASMRGYGIGKAVDLIRMAHPGAYEVMRTLQNDPTLLGPKQTLELAQLLEDPSKASSKVIESWLEKKPPQNLLIPLLLSTVDSTSGTELDTRIAVYLKANGWKPDLVALRKLTGHPDKYTRLFAYTEIFAIEDRETVRELLTMALGKEKDSQLHTQLEQMILESKR